MSKFSLCLLACVAMSSVGCTWVCQGTCTAPSGATSGTGFINVQAVSESDAINQATSMTNKCPALGSTISNVTCFQSN